MRLLTSSPKSRALLAPLVLVLLGTTVGSPCLAQESGTHKRTLKVDDKERQFLLHVPRNYKKAVKKRPAPLVIMLHGRTSNGAMAASRYYGWKELSEKEGFVAVFPTALGSPTSWQGAWRGKKTNDSVFLSDLIDLMLEELKIDEDRVFMTGHSSGGFMSFSFAASNADKVAAIAPVAGLVMDKSKPALPVSLISFHGMADSIVPYGTSRWGMPTAMESAELFAKHNGCKAAERVELNKGKVHLDTWVKGKKQTEVHFYSIEGGNHGWPQGGSKSVAATELIWEFFEAHPRNPDGKKGK
jgi:polyhydroxybutyrate depolymerase